MNIRRVLCGFAVAAVVIAVACDDDPPKDRPDLPVTLVDEAGEAGFYRVCWDQLDRSGERVPDHGYSVWIETSAGWDTVMYFTISHTADHAVSADCDSPGFKKLVPDEFGSRLNDSVYAPGDTVVIDFGLPVASSLTVRVFELGNI